MFYETLLVVHSLNRWLVVAAGALAAAFGFVGYARARPYAARDALAVRTFVSALDVQVLLGLLLYVVASPLTRIALRDPSAAMRASDLRFWLIEHPTSALVGTALAHVGAVRVRKASGDQAKHRSARLWFTLGLLALLAAVPWPGLAYARPLVRLP